MRGWRSRVGIGCAAVVVAVGGSAPLAGAGDGREGVQPPPGATYTGSAPLAKLTFAITAPAPRGGLQMRVTVDLACSKKSGAAAIIDTVQAVVAPDGSFDIDEQVSSPPEGGSSIGRVEVRGEFTDESNATADVTFGMFAEDDDGNVYDDCKDVERRIELTGGEVDPGLALVRAAIPVSPDTSFYLGTTAVSTDAVYAAVRRDEFDRRRGGRTSVVTRIDPTTDAVERRSKVRGDLEGLVTVGSELVGIDPRQGTVVAIDPETLRAGTPVQVAPPTGYVGRRFEDLPLWPQAAVADGAIWLSASRDRELVRLDPSSLEITARYPLDAHPTYLAAGPAGLYVATEGGADPAAQVVLRVDPTTGTVVATSAPVRNVGPVVASASEVVMTDRSAEQPILRLDPTSLTVVATSPIELAVPLVAAAPGLWTARDQDIVVLGPDLGAVAEVRGLVELEGETLASTGFDAVWLFDRDQQLVYRLATF